MKIHVSENTKLLLDQLGGFILEKRGNVEIKVEFSDSVLMMKFSLNSTFRGKEAWRRSGC